MTLDKLKTKGVELMLSNTDSLLLVGDNIEYLKNLIKNSSGQLDLVYVDAPYNTGSNLIYSDNRKSKSDTEGFLGTHTAWYDFMLPRIEAVKSLLKESGVVALSIDDYEFAYLKILMDRVFGEENMMGCITVCRSGNGRGSKRNVSINHEYLLLYGKSKSAAIRGVVDTTEYNKQDKYGCYRTDGLLRKKGDESLKEDRPNLYYPLYFNKETNEVSVDKIEGWDVAYPKDAKNISRRWVWSKSTAKIRAKELYASKKGVIYIKNYAGDKNNIKRTKIKTIWDEPRFYTNRATAELKATFGTKVFDTPKAIELMKHIIDICCHEKSIVLDLFSGSGATAQAISELNNQDGASRKCILMESSDLINRKHLASIAGYKRINEITEHRLSLIKEQSKNYTYRVINSPKKLLENMR